MTTTAKLVDAPGALFLLAAASAVGLPAEFMYFEDLRQKLLLRSSIRKRFLGSTEASGLELTRHEFGRRWSRRRPVLGVNAADAAEVRRTRA